MQLPDNYTDELARLTGLVLVQQDLETTLIEITRIAARLVAVADAVSITTFRDGRPSAVAFSDEWAKELDELQHAEREGPCLDAARTGNVFRIMDLSRESRWPGYAALAARHGACSALTIPLQAEGRTFGAMNLYARAPEAFSSEVVSLAEIIAGQAGQASQVSAAFFRHRDLADQLREAMASRAVIEQAKGVLMAQHKVAADVAFDLLRAASMQRNIKLRTLAQEVVETGQLGQ